MSAFHAALLPYAMPTGFVVAAVCPAQYTCFARFPHAAPFGHVGQLADLSANRSTAQGDEAIKPESCADFWMPIGSQFFDRPPAEPLDLVK